MNGQESNDSQDKNLGGRPEKVLNEEQIIQVEALASVLTTEQIADYLGIGRTTFYSVMERQPEVAERYKRGRAKAVANISGNLIKQAQAGNITAAIFYLKTQAGWSETIGIQNLDPPKVVMKMPEGYESEE